METKEEDPYPAPDAAESVSQGASFWEQVIRFFAWLFSPADVVQASGLDQAYPPPGGSPPATPPALPAIEITYLYDPLHRLTQADDSSGSYFHYAYDSNGNRLTETTPAGTKTALAILPFFIFLYTHQRRTCFEPCIGILSKSWRKCGYFGGSAAKITTHPTLLRRHLLD